MHPRLLPVLTILSLCACAGNPAPQPLTTTGGTAVEIVSSSNFQLVTAPWSKGTQSFSGYLGSDTTVAATGTIAANGAFSVTLPTSVPDAALTTLMPSVASGCTGTFTASDPAVLGTSLILRSTVGSETRPLSPETLSGTVTDSTHAQWTYRLGRLVYADRPATIGGTSTCVSGSGSQKTTYQIALVKGWNKLTTTYSTVTSGSTYTYVVTWTSGALPTDRWLFGSVD